MSKFWVHIHEKHAFHISVEAPSLEAAKRWAFDHSMDFVYATAREDDEIVSADVDSVEAMSEGDIKTYAGDIEVQVDAGGEEILDDKEAEEIKQAK